MGGSRGGDAPGRGGAPGHGGARGHGGASGRGGATARGAARVFGSARPGGHAMRLRVIAVGTRLPGWVAAAFEDYARRLHGPLRVELEELAAARRTASMPAVRATEAEGRRILAALAPRDHVVALDEHGTQFSTSELARWLEERRRSGQDLACIIGGADGLAPAVLARAQRRWSLSRLTLPHGLVRVVLIEQLYRASTLLAGHPYHRE